MKPWLRRLLNLISIAVTAFVVLVFVVGDWVEAYGSNLATRVLWVVLLSSTETFLAVTWKPSGRLALGIGVAKYLLVAISGLILLVSGLIAFALLTVIPGLFVGALGIALFVGVLLVAQGSWMLVWAWRHPGPIKD